MRSIFLMTFGRADSQASYPHLQVNMCAGDHAPRHNNLCKNHMIEDGLCKPDGHTLGQRMKTEYIGQHDSPRNRFYHTSRSDNMFL